MALFGYARVSTDKQDYELQVEKLIEFGVPEENIYTDKATGKNAERDGFKQLMKKIGEGDKFVAYKIDRIARSTKDFLNMVDEINDLGVELAILDYQGEKVDTTTPMGRFFLTIIAGMAELERNTIVQRTKEGRERAKEKGVQFGRKKTKKQLYVRAVEEYLETEKSSTEVIKEFELSKATFFRRLKEYKAEKGLV